MDSKNIDSSKNVSKTPAPVNSLGLIEYDFKKLSFRGFVTLYLLKTHFTLFIISIIGYLPIYFHILGSGILLIMYSWFYILLIGLTSLPLFYIILIPIIFNVFLLFSICVSMLNAAILCLLDLLIKYLRGETRPFTYEQAVKQQERNNKDPIPETPEKINYLNEYHRKTSERKMKYIADSKELKIDWEKEMERLKYNSQDHPPEEKMNKKELAMLAIKRQVWRMRHAEKIKELKSRNKVEDKTTKPDWITESEWEIKPNVKWWEDERAKMQSIAQQKPVTPEEALAQMSRLRNSERKMEYIAESKKLKIDWEKESERQKYNSQDHPQEEKMNLDVNNQPPSCPE